PAVPGGCSAATALQELPPGLLRVRPQSAPIGGVVGRIHLAALLGERLELHVVVALDQQVERRLNRRRPVVLFYRTAGSLRGRDVGTALVVVPRDVHLVARQAVAQVHHALERVV